MKPEAEQFAHAILEAPRAAISAATLLEAGIILDARIGHEDSSELDEFIANVGLEVEPVTVAQARAARQAYRSYGKGNHTTRLNFGDGFAYALAKTSGVPLLFKGGDFAQTNMTPGIRRPDDLLRATEAADAALAARDHLADAARTRLSAHWRELA